MSNSCKQKREANVVHYSLASLGRVNYTLLMSLRYTVGEIIFWLHVPIVLFWLGLFLVPESLFPGSVTFHFWFIYVVFASQMLWGLAMMPIRGRFGVGVCPLTTLNQWVRGYPISDKRNYDHTFLEELFARWHLRISPTIRQVILYATLLLVIIQYATQ